MAHELYSDFAIQNTFMSTVVLVNCYRLRQEEISVLDFVAQLLCSADNQCHFSDVVWQ